MNRPQPKGLTNLEFYRKTYATLGFELPYRKADMFGRAQEHLCGQAHERHVRVVLARDWAGHPTGP